MGILRMRFSQEEKEEIKEEILKMIPMRAISCRNG